MFFKRSLSILLILLASVSLAACRTNSSRSSLSVPSDNPSETTNFTDPAQEAKVVDELKRKEGPKAELLQFTVSPNTVDIKLRKASDDTAYGYLVDQSGFRKVSVEVSGSGSLKDSAFPISTLSAASYKALISNLTSKVGSTPKMRGAALLPNTATGELMWSGNYDTAKRTTLGFQAAPNGTKVRLVG